MVNTDETLPSVITEGSAVSIEKSEIYVFGGLKKSEPTVGASSSSNDLELLPSSSLYAGDLGSDKVTALATLQRPPAFASLTRLESKLYLTFGFHPEDGWSEDVFVYDIKSNLWSPLEIDEDVDEIPGPRDKHCAVAVDQEIFVFGGFGPMDDDDDDDEEEEEEEGLSAITEEQDNSGSSATPAHSADHTGDHSGEKEKALGPSASFSWFNELWVLSVDAASGLGRWRQPIFASAARPTPRAASSLCLDAARRRLVSFGGRDFTGRRCDVNLFDLSASRWRLDVAEGGPAPAERSFHAAAVSGDRLLVCGGRDSADRLLGDVHALDLRSLAWQRLDGAVTPRCCPAIAVREGEVLVMGGAAQFLPDAMVCGERVGTTQRLACAALTSPETEPSSKKPRLSDADTETNTETTSNA